MRGSINWKAMSDVLNATDHQGEGLQLQIFEVFVHGLMFFFVF